MYKNVGFVFWGNPYVRYFSPLPHVGSHQACYNKIGFNILDWIMGHQIRIGALTLTNVLEKDGKYLHERSH